MTKRHPQIRRRKSESGVALVTALCLLMIVSLLAASAVAISQYAERDSFTYSNLSRSSYVAESSANRIYWLIMNDRKKYPQRNIDTSQDALSSETERFVADGVTRVLKEYADKQDIRYQIQDAVSGLDISGSSPQRDIFNLLGDMPKEALERKRMEQLGNRMQDYVDSDDLLRLDGWEKKEYMQSGLVNLPRNRPFQYREELLYIPGHEEIARPDDSGRLSTVRLIAPVGLQPIAGRPSLYSTPVTQIAGRCRLSAQEEAEFASALDALKRENKPLQDSLPPGFLKRLEMYYGTSESSFYTVLIDTSGEMQPGVRLSVTFRAQFSNENKREFYEWRMY